MKVCLQPNEVCVSLALAEVAAVTDGRELSQRVRFGVDPIHCLTFNVRPDDVPRVSVHYTSGNLLVRVPRAQLTNWLHDDRRSISGEVRNLDGTIMAVEVRKDYKDLPKEGDLPDDDAVRFADDTSEWSRASIKARLDDEDDT